MDTVTTSPSEQRVQEAQPAQSDQQADTKTRNVTGYIHYNKDDDLTKIFEVLKDFRTRLGLKFSHHRDYIFFSLKSEHLNELAQKQPFRISHYRSKSEYKCDKATADLLTKQSDSFLRMTWTSESSDSSESNGVVQFLSRTTGRIHMYLVMRIFNDSTIKFDKTNYTVIKLQNQQDEQEQEQTKQTQQTRTFTNPRIPNVPRNTRSNFQQNDSSNDGFVTVTRGTSRRSNQNNQSNQSNQSGQSGQSNRVAPSGRTFAGRTFAGRGVAGRGVSNSRIEVEQSEPKPRSQQTSRTTYRDMVTAKK